MTVVAAILAAVKASRYLQIGLAMLLGLGGWHAYLAQRDAKVTTQVVQAINEKAAVVVKKGAEARKAAERPGAVDRLRMRYQEGGQ